MDQGLKEFRKIEINSIKIPEWATRSVLSDAEIEELAESIKVNNQLEPVIVRDMGDGRYELVSGFKRLKALEKLGRKTAEAKVIECNDSQALSISIDENLKRRDEHPFDVAKKISYMKNVLDLTGKQISQSIGREDSWVSMMLKIGSIDPEAKRILAPSVRDLRVLYLIAMIENPEHQRAIAKIVVEHDLSREEVSELIREYKRDPEGFFKRFDMPKSWAAEKSEPEKLRRCSICGRKTPRDQGRFHFYCSRDSDLIDEVESLLLSYAEEQRAYIIAGLLDIIPSLKGLGLQVFNEVVKKAKEEYLKQ
ncbi:MAG: ParB/RepB/Spo0J family partition protein [Thaumarchaeota archaeon]|jgi:ParB family chromosome partitioning protein|nr:ParB/RepB/Spo0J family partition protein [Candidatus Geocrenenecus arthurdayi]